MAEDLRLPPSPTEAAWTEVYSRGIDPARTRRFRGRVLLEVRCQPNCGRLVATVYPTTLGPLVVPDVADTPHGRTHRVRALRADLREQDLLELLFGQQPHDRRRDPWEELSGNQAPVPGSFLLDETAAGAAEMILRSEPDAMASAEDPVGWLLQEAGGFRIGMRCRRCGGPRWLTLAELQAAVVDGKRRHYLADHDTRV